jgi:hypothetical protein
LKIKQGDNMAKAEGGSKKSSPKKATNRAATSVEEPATEMTNDAAVGQTAEQPGEQAAAVSPAEAAPESTSEAAAEQPTGPSELDGAQLPATHGKAGLLGGPKDRGIKPDDKLALPTGSHFAYERVRSLNPKSFYCAMRWEYHFEHKSIEEGKRWWANKKLLITNPKNGVAVVVRAVDFGPHENTGLDISLSPGAAEALDIEVGDEVQIAFADQKASPGVVN